MVMSKICVTRFNNITKKANETWKKKIIIMVVFMEHQ